MAGRRWGGPVGRRDTASRSLVPTNSFSASTSRFSCPPVVLAASEVPRGAAAGPGQSGYKTEGGAPRSEPTTRCWAVTISWNKCTRGRTLRRVESLHTILGGTPLDTLGPAIERVCSN